MRVPFLDLSLRGSEELPRLMSAIQIVLEHGRLVMGPEVDVLERLLANSCDRSHAVAVGSGTDALYLALRALEVGPGDEVITTSLSWIATANAIALTGARPVFADICPDLNVDPQSVLALVTPTTRAILTVNYTGRMSETAILEVIATNAGISLVEDASQSFGARLDGRVSGSFGVASAMSHNPMKVLGALGEAGSIATNSPELAERMISLRYNGTVNRETCVTPSLNGRMDTVQAAVLIERLRSLGAVIEARRTNAILLDERLNGLVSTPPRDDRHFDVFYTYTVRSSRRDDLQAHLNQAGVETKVQHRLLMPQQPAYAASRGTWSNAARIVKQVLCLPVHEKLTIDQIDLIGETIADFGSSIVE